MFSLTALHKNNNNNCLGQLLVIQNNKAKVKTFLIEVHLQHAVGNSVAYYIPSFFTFCQSVKYPRTVGQFWMFPT